MAEINDEVHELEERAEHGVADPRMAPVSFTMAVLAVILATITLLGHRAHTHQIVMQTRANDQWGFYQGNDDRREIEKDVAKLMSVTDFKAEKKEAAEEIRKSFESDSERRKAKLEDIMKEAKTLEAEAQHEQRLANRFDLAEGFLEAALVITSITLLTRRRIYWGLGGAFAVLGIAVALSALFVH